MKPSFEPEINEQSLQKSPQSTQSYTNKARRSKEKTNQARCVASEFDADKTVTGEDSTKQSSNQRSYHSCNGQTSLTSNINHGSETANSIERNPLTKNVKWELSHTINNLIPTDDDISWHSMESWENLCQVDCHCMKSHDGCPRVSTLPHDLKFVETSELLPMAYDEFTKCLEENFWEETSDDDCVVPSVSPAKRDLNVNCLSSEASSHGANEQVSQLHSLDQRKNEKTERLRPPTTGSLYGTLNWGLSPTIIYKTPGLERSVDVGTGCMKCSISEGNVQMVSLPQSNSGNVFRRRKRTTPRCRKEIHFDDPPEDLTEKGVQEVPTNHDQDTDDNHDSDCVPVEPMWFTENNECAAGVDQLNLRMYEDLQECYANPVNVLPKKVETTSREQILNVAVEHIRDLRQKINDWDRRTGKLPLKESQSSEPGDIFGVLSDFSWCNMDESSHEIQTIFDSFTPLANTSIHYGHSSVTSPSPGQKLKKKRKYRKSSVTKEKRCKKSKNISSTVKSEPAKMATAKFTSVAPLTPQNPEGIKLGDCSTPEWHIPTKASASSMVNNQNSHVSISPGKSPTICTDSNQTTRPLEPLQSPKSTSSCCQSPITGLAPLKTVGTPSIFSKTLTPISFSSPPTSCPIVYTSGSPVLTAGVSPLNDGISIPVCYSSPSFPSSSLAATATALITSGIVPLAAPPLTLFEISPPQLANFQDCWSSPDRGSQRNKVEKFVKKKTIPNGYMLFCKQKRGSLLGKNPELKSTPGELTRLLSQNWNQLTEEDKKPFIDAAMRMRSETFIEMSN